MPPKGIGAAWQLGFDRIGRRATTARLGGCWIASGPTLLVALATLLLTAVSISFIPKGLVSDTGHGAAAGGGARARIRVVRAHGRAAAGRRSSDPKDPDVESLSSFIGVDGANTTALNRGRMLINLKPHGDRGALRRTSCGAAEHAANVAGATLYLQPVQDLTIDAETGPTNIGSRSKARTRSHQSMDGAAGRQAAERRRSFAT